MSNKVIDKSFEKTECYELRKLKIKILLLRKIKN
jgi:hypothetical protein